MIILDEFMAQNAFYLFIDKNKNRFRQLMYQGIWEDPLRTKGFHMIKIYDENNVQVELVELLKSIDVNDLRELVSAVVNKPVVKKFLEELIGDE